MNILFCILYIMPKVKWLPCWKRYWRLVTLWEFERRPVGKKWAYQRYEKCKCDCWNVVWVNKWNLKKWHTRSCWCFWNEHRAECWNINKKHWDWNTRLYRIFYDVRQRCNNPKNDRYYCYWARWIKCLRDKYEDFKTDMNEWYLKHCWEFWEDNTTIDRIDVNWNYCKENCRWATRKEQMLNLRRSRRELRDWKELSITEIFNIANPVVCYSTFVARYYTCWRKLKDALYTPLKHPRTNFNSVKNK